MAKRWHCDCSCIARGLETRHIAASVDALARELDFILENKTPCPSCPALDDFRRVFSSNRSRVRLASMAAAQFNAHPCAPSLSAANCIGAHSWKMVRVSTLFADLGRLQACEIAPARRACGPPAARPFVHVQAYHAAAAHGATYEGALGFALDGPRRNECDVALTELAPTLQRYDSAVLGETAGIIALGLGAECLGLPDWISFGSWKQDRKGHRLPCRNWTSFPFETIGRGLPGPVAGVYADVNRMPRQVVRGPWKELYNLVGLSLVRRTHISRLHEAAGAGWAGRSYPCCNYFVARRSSFRALAKLHAVFVAHLYLHPGSPSSWAEPHSWAGADWAALDHGTGCWRFEGPQHPRKGDNPRMSTSISYQGEERSILFLFLTHALLSLGGKATPDDCRSGLESAVHRQFFGKTSLDAIERLYDDLAARYTVR